MNLKVPKCIIFKKCDFTMGKPYFSRLGGPQREYERFRKAPKRHLKSFKTSEERVPKIEPNNNSFCTNFGAEMDSDMEPPRNRKLDQKWNRNWNCIWRTEMGVENANTVNCRCRCRYKSCQMNKRKEYIYIRFCSSVWFFGRGQGQAFLGPGPFNYVSCRLRSSLGKLYSGTYRNLILFQTNLKVFGACLQES